MRYECVENIEADEVKALTWKRAGMFEGPKAQCGWNALFFFMLAINQGSQIVGEGCLGEDANRGLFEARLGTRIYILKLWLVQKHHSFSPHVNFVCTVICHLIKEIVKCFL